MSIIRRNRGRHLVGGRSRPTRAELRAESRRARAMSHLRRVRGQVPSAAPRRAVFAVAAAVSLLAGAVFGVSVAGGASHFGGGEAALDAIWVRGASHLPAAEIARVTGVVPSAVRAEVVAAEIVERLESHAWIAKARALWLPTGALLVDITEAVAVAVVDAGSPRRTYVVDAGGTPFALAEEQHDGALPRLATGKAVAPFEPSEQIAQALELARKLPGLGLAQPVEISVAADSDGTGFALRLAGLPARIVLGREDLDAKLRELVRLLAADVPGIEDAKELDLRFADQAVLRNGPPREGAEQAAATRGRARPSI